VSIRVYRETGEGVTPPSFEELFRATGGVRLGMRARRRQKGCKNGQMKEEKVD